MNNASALRRACRAAALPGRDVAYDPHLLGANTWVPYIAAWSGEAEDRTGEIIQRPDGVGIGYTHETILDRDEYGALWRRTVNRVGVGRPLFMDMHPQRQRQAMRRLLCQVCAKPADRDERGVLWLLNDYRQDWRGWPERMGNTQPPVCRPCARAAVRLCPSLRRGWVAVRSQRHPMAGVSGGVYRPAFPRPRLVGIDTVTFDNPGVWWVQAAQLVRELHGCTLLDQGDLS